MINATLLVWIRFSLMFVKPMHPKLSVVIISAGTSLGFMKLLGAAKSLAQI